MYKQIQLRRTMNNSIIFQDVTLDDLKDVIREAITSELQKSKPEIPTNSTIKYLTRKETAKLLCVSLTTLYNLTKTGAINAHRIGKRVLYSQDEIENSLIQIQSLKYKRGLA